MVECTLLFRKQATSIYVVVDEPFYTLKYNNFIPQSQGINNGCTCI
jgi:hypothetical protein